MILHIIHRHIKPTEPQKQKKSSSTTLIIKHPNLLLRITQTPLNPPTQTNVVCKFTSSFQECFSKNNITPNIMTMLNKRTDKLKFPDIRKILINNTKIIYKNNNKNFLEILKGIIIKDKKPTIKKIAFTTTINIKRIQQLTTHPNRTNQPHLWFIKKWKKKATLNKYKTHNFPNNKQFSTTPKYDQQNGWKCLG